MICKSNHNCILYIRCMPSRDDVTLKLIECHGTLLERHPPVFIGKLDGTGRKLLYVDVFYFIVWNDFFHNLSPVNASETTATSISLSSLDRPFDIRSKQDSFSNRDIVFSEFFYISLYDVYYWIGWSSHFLISSIFCIYVLENWFVHFL